MTLIMTKCDNHVRLFSKKMEYVVLLVPVLVLVLAGLEQRYFHEVRSIDRRYFMLTANLVGLNLLHVYFTFTFVMSSTEFRKWCELSTGGRPHRYWLRIAFVFASSCAGILFFYRVFPLAAPALLFISWILQFLPIHHALTQQFGLSQSYSAKASSTFDYNESERARLNQNSLNERRLTFVFIALFAIVLLFDQIKYFRKGFYEAVIVDRWSDTVALLGLLVACALVLNALRFPRVWRTNKLWFLSRYLILGFGLQNGYSLIALQIAQPIFHGTEYLGVYANLTNNSLASKQNSHRRKNLFYLVLFCLFGTAIILLARGGLVHILLFKDYFTMPTALRLFGVLQAALSCTHFYIDASLFRMRDPSSRKIIAPLLMGGA